MNPLKRKTEPGGSFSNRIESVTFASMVKQSTLSNSTLEPWLDYQVFSNELPPLQPCSIAGVTVNCTDVCAGNNWTVSSLFDASAPNLMNCGLWSSLYERISYSIDDISGDPSVISALASFQDVGFPAAPSLLLDFQETVGKCLTALLTYSLTGSPEAVSQDLDLSTCSINMIFGDVTAEARWTQSQETGIHDCMHGICFPKGSLNPELGGIGVSPHACQFSRMMLME